MNYRTCLSAFLILGCLSAFAGSAPHDHHRHRPGKHDRVLIYDRETGTWTFYDDGKALEWHAYIQTDNTVTYKVVNINPFIEDAKGENNFAAVKADTLTKDEQAFLGGTLGAAAQPGPSPTPSPKTTANAGAGDQVNSSLTKLKDQTNPTQFKVQVATLPQSLGSGAKNFNAAQFEKYVHIVPAKELPFLRSAQAMAKKYAEAKPVNEAVNAAGMTAANAGGDPTKIREAIGYLAPYKQNATFGPKIRDTIAQLEEWAVRAEEGGASQKEDDVIKQLGDRLHGPNSTLVLLEKFKADVKILHRVTDGLAHDMWVAQSAPSHSFGNAPDGTDTPFQSEKTRQLIFDMQHDAANKAAIALSGLVEGGDPKAIDEARLKGWGVCQKDYSDFGAALNGDKNKSGDKGVEGRIDGAMDDINKQIDDATSGNNSGGKGAIKTLITQRDTLIGLKSEADAQKKQGSDLNDSLTKGEDAYKKAAELAARRYSEILKTDFTEVPSSGSEVQEGRITYSLTLYDIDEQGKETKKDLKVQDYVYDGVDRASIRPILAVGYVFATYFAQNRTFGTEAVTGIPGYTSRIIQHSTEWLTSTTAVFAHIPFSQSGPDAWAFSFGAATDASRYYAGAGYIWGRLRGVVLSGGLALGRFDELDNQKVGDLLTQNATPRTKGVLRPGIFLGISYRL